MRCIQLVSLVFFASFVPATSLASPARPLLSIDIGPAFAIDGRVGASGDARGAIEMPLSTRVSLGVGIEAGAAAWSDVGEMQSGNVVGASAFGQLHVAVRLTPSLVLEPAVGFGVIHTRGDMVRGTLPAYSSTVALVRDNLRLGVNSRVCIGEVDGFSPDAQLSLFVGWQG